MSVDPTDRYLLVYVRREEHSNGSDYQNRYVAGTLEKIRAEVVDLRIEDGEADAAGDHYRTGDDYFLYRLVPETAKMVEILVAATPNYVRAREDEMGRRDREREARQQAQLDRDRATYERLRKRFEESE